MKRLCWFKTVIGSFKFFHLSYRLVSVLVLLARLSPGFSRIEFLS